MTSFLSVALRPTILRRGLAYSLVVGTILVGINQGDVIFSGGASWRHLLKIGLTYMVPFLVSTLSSVSAIRERETVRKT
ncbi:nitrate/nitrite transporter NrtS [Crateriforma spongiae]|uniref:nitrate/nitrite transporter NrtS n=1 Tax=Crateriforma spongiae TaxID=2724528 RepID=UPI0039AFBC22